MRELIICLYTYSSTFYGRLLRKQHYSACFFSQNSIFLLQEFSQNSVFSQFQPQFSMPNGASVYPYGPVRLAYQSYFFCKETLSFSRNKLANSTFQPGFSVTFRILLPAYLVMCYQSTFLFFLLMLFVSTSFSLWVVLILPVLS